MEQIHIRRLPYNHNFAVQVYRDNKWDFLTDFNTKVGGYVCMYSEDEAYAKYKACVGQMPAVRLVKVSTYLASGSDKLAVVSVIEFNETRSK